MKAVEDAREVSEEETKKKLRWSSKKEKKRLKKTNHANIMWQKNPKYRKRCGNELFWLNALTPMSALGLQFSCMRMSRSRESKGV